MIVYSDSELKEIIDQALDEIAKFYHINRGTLRIRQTIFYTQPRSVTIKLKFRNEGARLKDVFLKVNTHRDYLLSSLDAEVKSLVDMNNKFDCNANLGVPKLIGYIPEKKTIITEAINGKSLYNIFVDMTFPLFISFTRDMMMSSVGLAAKWLNIAHDEKPADIDRIIEDEIYACRIRIEILKKHMPERITADFCERFLDIQKKNALSFAGAKTVWTHGDFSPVNMIFNKDSLYVLDMTHADVVFCQADIVRFWQVLDNMKNAFPMRKGIFNDMQQAFISSYKEKVDISSPAFYFYRLKESITNLVAYRMALEHKRRHAKKIYNLYFMPQLKCLYKLMERAE